MEIEVFMTPFWNLSYDMSYPRWVYKIDSAGWSMSYRNTTLDKLGDILQVLMHLIILYNPLLISLFRMLELGHMFG